jgi:type IV pilus assembly protein PilX
MSDQNLGLFRYQRQQGAALLISLIFLLLLTILGVASMRSATLQERMAGNARDNSIAMQSAEYGIQQAEAVLSDGNFSPSTFVGSQPGYVAQIANGAAAVAWSDTYNWGGASQSRGLTNAAGALQANFVIEQFAAEANSQEKNMNSQGKSGQRSVPVFNKTTSYRVTSRASGQSGNTTVILQEVYRRNEQ